MAERGMKWVWRAVMTIAVALAVTNVALIVVSRHSLAGGDLLFNMLGALASVLFASIGRLIAVRARSVIGWILVGAGLSIGLQTLSAAYAEAGLVAHPGTLPAPKLVAALLQPMWIPSLISLGLMLLLFPVGIPPSPRWRPVLWIGIAGAAVGYVGLMLNPVPINLYTGLTIANPIGIQSQASAISTTLVGAAWVTVLAVAASFAGLVVRFRRGDPDLRRQVKWLGFTAAGAGACVLIVLVSLIVCTCDHTVLGDVMFGLFFIILVLGVPGAVAMAIFKYRLYDIDVIISKAFLYGILAAFFTGVYLAVVIGVGSAVGSRGSSSLTIAAAVLIAMAFQPARERARRLANRIAYGKRATPYEVLSEFSERVAGTYASEDVLPRMAQILATGTGAAAARVWLRLGTELRESASWPEGEAAAPVRVADDRAVGFPPGEFGVEVRHQGELLGALSVSMPPSDPMNPSKEKLVGDLAGQAGLVLRNVRLIEELRASRRRIVTAQDERAKALERNIHDGAQQQLVALSVKQRLAEGLIERDPEKARRMLADIQADTVEALENLRDLARGIYPPLLADQGLASALSAQARKAPLPVEVEADGIGRYPPEAEAAVYFCCLEAMQNVAKYANASGAVIRLREDGGTLIFAVGDDGRGFDPGTTSLGSGLQGMADRLEALGGTLEVRSEPGRGTTVTGRLPAGRVEQVRGGLRESAGIAP